MAIKYKYVRKFNPQDPTAPQKVYAMAVHENVFKLKELARELAARSTTASEGDTYAVLVGMRDLIREHLERSDKVVIDGIVSIAINISSEGAASEEEFRPSMIKGTKAVYQQDAEMKEFTSKVKCEKIPNKK